MLRFERIEVNGEKVIAIFFGYDEDLINKVKTIPGRKWNANKKAWLVPDNDISVAAIRELFGDVKIFDGEKNKNSKVYVYVMRHILVLHLKYNRNDIDFVKKLDGAVWDNENKVWNVANTEKVRNSLNEYFGDRLNLTSAKRELNSENVEKELLIFNHIPGRIKLVFKYDKELKKLVKSLPYSMWDEKNQWWTTVDSDDVLNKLKEFASENNWRIKYVETKKQSSKKRITAKNVPVYKKCPEEYINSLKIRRYSPNTIKSYVSLFEEFINFYYYKKPIEITEKEIIAYIRYLVVERQVSRSTQNQAINAIKYYYEKVLGEARKFYFVERPKKEKVLPTVLNKKEIEKMIGVTTNTKHKCLIMLTYSSGLRLSEVQNLKLEDIDYERNIVNVKGGKGKKDRITLLSKKTKLYLHKYLLEYKPRVWVFEGIKGGKYATTSMEKVVKHAARKAGIMKNVTMHTLRHSFATHLIEKGTDIRYIQALLGHESIKTTEIYTHVTNKGLDQITNPLDDLDISDINSP